MRKKKCIRVCVTGSPCCTVQLKNKKKKDVVHTMEYYSAIKKNKIMPFAATWMELETHTKWSQKEKENTIWYHLLLESNIQHKWTYLQKRNKLMDLKNRVGWNGSLELVDANYCLWNGLAMRSCYLAPGTMSSHLWWSMIMCFSHILMLHHNWLDIVSGALQ